MIDFHPNVLPFLHDLSPEDLAELKTATIAKMPILNAVGRAMMMRLDPFKAPRLANAMVESITGGSRVTSFLGVPAIKIPVVSAGPSLEDF